MSTTEVKPGNSKLPNVKALQEFRLKGAKVVVGEVVSKGDFANKQDWLNLLNMPKPRIEETDEKVGKPAKAAKADAKMPGA